ncbi:Flp family type IVb pilin [Paenarthrobacter sp. Z7-10]|uniref:Flp family type IVb pilin n=1 Tax=Paenarthrobacter sp. Z7-10 TaxID=2787635 RepID=UPI0022A953A2|nr:Flp family type IVb pilin [Paenarthrobacter sp. Z7-10]MCZ2402573.1 Flp family type IVb pilin [Paenarthrobacter sp. Z7-10]
MVSLFASLHCLGLNLQARLRREQTGATAVEYALLVGLIAVVLIAGVGLFGKDLTAFFSGLASKTFNATPTAG